MMMQLENSLFLKKSNYSFKHILPRSFTMFCIRNSLRSTAKPWVLEVTPKSYCYRHNCCNKTALLTEEALSSILPTARLVLLQRKAERKRKTEKKKTKNFFVGKRRNVRESCCCFCGVLRTYLHSSFLRLSDFFRNKLFSTS